MRANRRVKMVDLTDDQFRALVIIKKSNERYKAAQDEAEIARNRLARDIYNTMEQDVPARIIEESCNIRSSDVYEMRQEVRDYFEALDEVRQHLQDAS